MARPAGRCAPGAASPSICTANDRAAHCRSRLSRATAAAPTAVPPSRPASWSMPAPSAPGVLLTAQRKRAHPERCANAAVPPSAVHRTSTTHLIGRHDHISPPMTTAPYKELTAAVRGDLIMPGDRRYDEARAVCNAMLDKRPAAIARCRDVANVIACSTSTRTSRPPAGLTPSAVQCQGGHDAPIPPAGPGCGTSPGPAEPGGHGAARRAGTPRAGHTSRHQRRVPARQRQFGPPMASRSSAG